METRNQVARLLIVNGLVFILCQTPNRIVNITDGLNKLGISIFTDDQLVSILILARSLIILNAGINPYLYILCSKSYRQAFLETLGWKPTLKASADTEHRVRKGKELQSVGDIGL